MLPEGLLEPLFAGGIDALANDPDAVQFRHTGGAADAVTGFGLALPRCLVRQTAGQRLDEIRAGAAAAPQDGHAQVGKGLHLPGKLLRGDLILVGHRVRQTGVGLDNNRQIRPLHQFLRQWQNLLGAQGAVDADGVHAQSLQGEGHSRNRAAGKGAVVLLKGHGHIDGQITALLGGQDSGPHLSQVGHCLKDHQIGPGGGPSLHHLPEEVIGLLKGQGAQRLQQLADGAHVQSHQGAGLFRRLSGHLDRLSDHLLHRIAGTRQLVGVGAKGIGVDHVAARPEIPAVDVCHHLRRGKAQDLRPLAQGQAGCQQLGAHGAVQKLEGAQCFSILHRVFLPFSSHSVHTWRSPGSRGSSGAGAYPPHPAPPLPTSEVSGYCWLRGSGQSAAGCPAGYTVRAAARWGNLRSRG